MFLHVHLNTGNYARVLVDYAYVTSNQETIRAMSAKGIADMFDDAGGVHASFLRAQNEVNDIIRKGNGWDCEALRR